ncbi:MAG: amidohydrolase [Bacteroidota bacterium]
MNKKIIELRQELHQNPEVSNNEYRTASRILDFTEELKPDEIIKLGSTGLAFVFKGKNKGKTLMFRAELDALPILESNNFDYISVNHGVSHSCGHDGHMAIIAGLAQKIANNRPEKGKVVLLFQPAEEIEQGAKDVVEDPNFKKIEPDYIFALHNIPGIEKHKILLKTGSFAAASKGMTIELTGKTSHAAEPEEGINPVVAISEIIKKLKNLINDKKQFKDFSLLSFIYIRMGEISFGTSAGKAKIGITLRAFENCDMDLLTEKSEQIIKNICKKEKLEYNINYDEIFPATVNYKKCVTIIERASKENNYIVDYIEKPFKWSEDFGYYTEKYKSGFFGLGSGINQPALHNPEFDFPDDIIETGVKVFCSIYKKVNF